MYVQVQVWGRGPLGVRRVGPHRAEHMPAGLGGSERLRVESPQHGRGRRDFIADAFPVVAYMLGQFGGSFYGARCGIGFPGEHRQFDAVIRPLRIRSGRTPRRRGSASR